MKEKLEILIVFVMFIIFIGWFIQFKTNQINDTVYVGTIKEFELQKITNHILSVETIAIIKLDTGETVLLKKKTGALKVTTNKKVFYRKAFNEYLIKDCIKRYC